MKIKNQWQGIKVEVLGNTTGPINFTKRFEGASEADKVLVYHEETVIENVIIAVGGFNYEIEMSLDESIQQIKNAREICSLIREEMNNFADFFPEFINKVATIAADMDKKKPAEEAAPESSATAEEAAPAAETVETEATPNIVQTVLAKVMAELGKGK